MKNYITGFFCLRVRNPNDEYDYESFNLFLYGQTIDELICSFYLQLLEDGWKIHKKQSNHDNGWIDGLLAYNSHDELKRLDIILQRSVMLDVNSRIVEALLVNLKDLKVQTCTVIDVNRIGKKQVDKAIKKCLKLKFFSEFYSKLEDSQYLFEEENYSENDHGILNHE